MRVPSSNWSVDLSNTSKEQYFEAGYEIRVTY
jgi:hypothetical protein